MRTLAFEAERLKLKQSALAETRVTWNDRSTQFTTAIAMLAVALFLVGFAVVLGGPRRTVFYVLGVGFATLTLAWAGYIYNLPIPETSDAAIAATARGIVESGEGHPGAAVTAFTKAVTADGDYVAPYTERAVARVLEANPDFRTTGAVTGGGSGLAGAIADSQRAIELGGTRDFRTYAVLCLLRLYTGDYDAAVAAADAAIAINGAVPDVRLARSAAEVGRGDAAAAHASLDGAVRLLRGSDPSERTRGLSAEYLTYLEQVAAASPARGPLAHSLEQETIGIETRFNLGRPVSGSPPAAGIGLGAGAALRRRRAAGAAPVARPSAAHGPGGDRVRAADARRRMGAAARSRPLPHPLGERRSGDLCTAHAGMRADRAPGGPLPRRGANVLHHRTGRRSDLLKAAELP